LPSEDLRPLLRSGDNLTAERGDPTSRRALVGNGDVTDLREWGGHPYFFLRAGLRNGLFQTGVAIHRERLRHRRLLWNAMRPFLLERPGGFQYSRGCRYRAWTDRTGPADVTEYVSHFPLQPPADLVHEPVTYYLDATLHQNFDSYVASRVGKRMQVEALEREREAYLAARYVVCWSRWCADDVESFYGISSDKVRVIPPGAGIDEDSVPDPLPWDGNLSPLRLGLIGIRWKEKGGPLLLQIATALERMGHAVEVVVIGPPVADVPRHPSLRPEGFIDKSRELPRFVELVRSLHFGCLLSSDEAFGVSNLECIRLGVPVIGMKVDGIPETVPSGAGLLVGLEQTGEEIAELLAAIVRTPEEYASMRKAAQEASAFQSWNRAADSFLALLGERSVAAGGAA